MKTKYLKFIAFMCIYVSIPMQAIATLNTSLDYGKVSFNKKTNTIEAYHYTPGFYFATEDQYAGYGIEISHSDLLSKSAYVELRRPSNRLNGRVDSVYLNEFLVTENMLWGKAKNTQKVKWYIVMIVEIKNAVVKNTDVMILIEQSQMTKSLQTIITKQDQKLFYSLCGNCILAVLVVILGLINLFLLLKIDRPKEITNEIAKSDQEETQNAINSVEKEDVNQNPTDNEDQKKNAVEKEKTEKKSTTKEDQKQKSTTEEDQKQNAVEKEYTEKKSTNNEDRKVNAEKKASTKKDQTQKSVENEEKKQNAAEKKKVEKKSTTKEDQKQNVVVEKEYTEKKLTTNKDTEKNPTDNENADQKEIYKISNDEKLHKTQSSKHFTPILVRDSYYYEKLSKR